MARFIFESFEFIGVLVELYRVLPYAGYTYVYKLGIPLLSRVLQATKKYHPLFSSA